MSRKNLQNLTLDFSTKENTKTFDHEGFIAGIAPNLRGPYSTMYVVRPWTIRQYAEKFRNKTKSNI